MNKIMAVLLMAMEIGLPLPVSAQKVKEQLKALDQLKAFAGCEAAPTPAPAPTRRVVVPVLPIDRDQATYTMTKKEVATWFDNAPRSWLAMAPEELTGDWRLVLATSKDGVAYDPGGLKRAKPTSARFKYSVNPYSGNGVLSVIPDFLGDAGEVRAAIDGTSVKFRVSPPAGTSVAMNVAMSVAAAPFLATGAIAGDVGVEYEFECRKVSPKDLLCQASVGGRILGIAAMSPHKDYFGLRRAQP